MDELDSYNITSFDAEKTKVNQLIRMYNLFVSKKKKDHIHTTLTNSGNPLVKTMHDILMDTLPEVDDKHPQLQDRYRKMISNPLEFFLYIYYTDSAYGDIGDFMLWRFLQKIREQPELETYLNDRVKKPSNWYFNIWSSNMLETKKKQESGELPTGVLCDSELLQVDENQKRVVEDYAKKNVKRNQSLQHW